MACPPAATVGLATKESIALRTDTLRVLPEDRASRESRFAILGLGCADGVCARPRERVGAPHASHRRPGVRSRKL